MAIVDFHMHFFSRPFFEALCAQSPQPGTAAEKLGRLAASTGLEVPPADLATHTGRWIAQMDRHGVAHMAAFASLPEEIPALVEANGLARGRLTPFALVNPRAAGAPESVRTLLRDKGFGGVLLFPAMHHFHVGGSECAPVLSVLAEFRATAFVHCGLLVVKLRDLLGLPRPFELAYANPLGVVPAANSHPRVSFVIPHFGAGYFRETLMAGAQCQNIYVDTSSSNSWMATQESRLSLGEVFDRALGVFGAGRILFGTDSNTFPAGWRRDRYEEQHGALSELGLAEGDMERIFADNARRLLERS